MEILTFSFTTAGKEKAEKYDKGTNWPVVYFLYNSDTLYIGESSSAARRMDEHLRDKKKKKENLKEIKIVFDDEFNKSVVLDYEQRLIRSCRTDKTFKKVLNANPGQSDQHDYYQRTYYDNHFHYIWDELMKQKMVKKTLDVIENENLYKYSPYVSLNDEQREVQISILNDIYDVLKKRKKGISLVNGCAGTGKTVLAISIINSLVNAVNLVESMLSEEQKRDELNQARLRIKWFIQHERPIKIGIVFPMSGIRSVIEDVFGEAGHGLHKNMVITPYSVMSKDYDVLFVDESHRLAKRKNLGQPRMYKLFDRICNGLGLDPSKSNQLDWILKRSKYTVLFYDEDQSIKSTDITHREYMNSLKPYKRSIKNYQLTSQMRCVGGNLYINYVKDLLKCRLSEITDIANYEFKVFRDVDKMVNAIREKDYELIKDGNDNNLCKVVAGFSWEWKTQLGVDAIPDTLDAYNEILASGNYDIEMQGHHYIWNLVTKGWIPRHDSHYTIGCIHTTQGFDMNYVGVIFGREINYDPVSNEIVIDPKEFKDNNVKRGCDEATLKRFIINTYTTMMARGIKGCYVCAYHPELQNYLERFIKLGD